MSEFGLKGFKQIADYLDILPVKSARNIARGGLRAGANAILPTARANIRSQSGLTAKSLKVGTKARGALVTASVHTRRFNAQWLEYGTKPHTITARNRKVLSIGGLFFQSVEHPGARPHPFLRPAMDTQAQAALVATGEYWKERLATKEGLDTAHVQIEVEDP